MNLSPNVLFLGLLLVTLLFFAVVIRIKFFPKGVRADGDPVYQPWGTILTPTERSFVATLEKALPEGVRLLAKVRLADVFFIRKDLDFSRRAAARNRMSPKHVDFLLVRSSDFAPLMGVELDDQSHAPEGRQKRDRFIDGVFADCHLPILHIRAQAAYNEEEIRAKIAALLTPVKEIKASTG